jgi:hypothetical protein
MRKLTKIVAILAFLGGRGAFAQTAAPAGSLAGSSSTVVGPLSLAQNARSVDGAPVGHRQPHVGDVPSHSRGELEHLTAEDAAVDRKLVICHGC